MRYIMLTCPQREAIFLDTVEHCPVPLTVVTDRSGVQREGFMAVHREGAGRDFVMLEDDILFAEDFEEKLLAVVRSHREVPITFFRPGKSKIKEAGYYPGKPSFSYTQCCFFPGHLSAEFLTWDDCQSKKIKDGDLYFRNFLGDRPFYAHFPSLVQHKRVKSAVVPSRPYRGSDTF